MFTALKPCKICGIKYLIDDTVNVDLLTEQQIAALVKKKYLAYVDNSDDAIIQKTAIPVDAGDGSLNVELSGDEIVEVFTVLQISDNTAAIEIVSEISNIDELRLLKATVIKKPVKEAVVKRYEEICKSYAENGNPKRGNGNSGDE